MSVNSVRQPFEIVARSTSFQCGSILVGARLFAFVRAFRGGWTACFAAFFAGDSASESESKSIGLSAVPSVFFWIFARNLEFRFTRLLMLLLVSPIEMLVLLLFVLLLVSSSEPPVSILLSLVL